jgi:hypothetical protein
MRVPLSLVLALLIIGTSSVKAQELWTRPEQYFYKVGEKSKIELVTGTNFIGTPASFRRADVEVLSLIFNLIKLDVRRNFVEGEKASFTLELPDEGVYQYLFKAAPTVEHLSSADFDAYLKNFDLQDLINERTQAGATANDSVKLVKDQYIKGYVRTGESFSKRPETPVETPIEIIPDKYPLVLNRGDKITFKVLREGKPAFGVRVTIWNRWNNRTTIQHIYTQQDGTVSTSISSPGDWMATVVDVKRSSEPNEYIAKVFNLVFGFR